MVPYAPLPLLPLLHPPLPFLSCPFPPPSSPNPHSLLPVACGGASQDVINEGGIVGDGAAGSKHDVTDGEDTDDRAYTTAEGQEDDGPSPSHAVK